MNEHRCRYRRGFAVSDVDLIVRHRRVGEGPLQRVEGDETQPV